MCAGTYGHDLLGIDQGTSEGIRCALDRGEVTAKPGWIRCSFGPGTSEGEFRVLLDAVPEIARNWRHYAESYRISDETAEWSHESEDGSGFGSLSLQMQS